MDCQKFRDTHALFVDERCSTLEAFEMRSHMRYCAACSRFDTVVRRSQLLVRNLPSIQPSAKFRARLHERLLAEGRARLEEDAAPATPGWRAATAAGLCAAAVIIALVSQGSRPSRPVAIRLAPVVASLPERAPAQYSSSAFVASVPTGMPMWSGMLVAGQVQAQLVATELTGER